MWLVVVIYARQNEYGTVKNNSTEAPRTNKPANQYGLVGSGPCVWLLRTRVANGSKGRKSSGLGLPLLDFVWFCRKLKIVRVFFLFLKFHFISRACFVCVYVFLSFRNVIIVYYRLHVPRVGRVRKGEPTDIVCGGCWRSAWKFPQKRLYELLTSVRRNDSDGREAI